MPIRSPTGSVAMTNRASSNARLPSSAIGSPESQAQNFPRKRTVTISMSPMLALGVSNILYYFAFLIRFSIANTIYSSSHIDHPEAQGSGKFYFFHVCALAPGRERSGISKPNTQKE